MRKQVSVVSIGLASVLLQPSAAQAVELKLTVAGQTVSGQLVNPDNYCGVEVDFGDGASSKHRVGTNGKVAISHNYAKPGTYTVKAEPKTIFKGLKTAGPCVSGAQVALTVGEASSASAAPPAPAPQAPEAPSSVATADAAKTSAPETQSAPAPTARGLQVYLRANENGYALANKLDGKTVFLDAQRVPKAHNYCLVTTGDGYADDVKAVLPKLVERELQTTIKRLGGSPNADLRQSDCIERAGRTVAIRNYGMPWVVVQADLEAQLPNIRNWKGYVKVGQLSGSQVSAAVADALEKQQAAALAERQREGELTRLAQDNSSDYVSSISLSYPDQSENLRICARKGSADFNQAVSGYFAIKNLPLSKGFIDAAVSAKAKIDRGNPVRETFADLDAFYLAWQRNPKGCQVLVDHPAQLKQFINAAQRGGQLKYELNPIMKVGQAREQWAQRKGYESLEAYGFAQAIGGDATDLKRLSAAGVTSKGAFDAAASRMKKTGYAKSSSVGDVVAFLKDESAGEQKGISAVAIKTARVKAQQQEAADRARRAEQARAAEAAKYPYYAVFSCGFGGSTYSTMACFSGSGKYGTNTTIKVTTGNSEREYQLYDIANGRVGQEQRDGLHIKLPSRFYIVAQNANKTLALTLSVYDTKTGRKLVQKQAANLFGVVSYAKR